MEVVAFLLIDALAKQDGLGVLVQQVTIMCNVVIVIVINADLNT